MSSSITRGVLQIHSAPQALCPHVQWALESLSRGRSGLHWVPQEAAPGALRAELEWAGPVGTGALMASALRTLGKIRFEITEEPSPGTDGSRWSFTPDLGVFHATTDAAGNVVVSEDRIRHAYVNSKGDPALVVNELSLALGEAWDEELEPFRLAAEGVPVRWLHRVS
ncbi:MULTISPECIES: DUF3145 domain-containing protein [Kocuria]|uniref:DUF3145 domain-containing protein n=1 Tax=Kocuria subflava TaxID=1736139 RepID=A0A846TTL1_9MICC|nr:MULTISPECIES: DUF3145 domain-containing protein [Kocuria]NKE09104.1 DUF3145 domain-containing protein [Kocuria subflava]